MLFKNFIETYKKRYTIPYLDLADAGESNRILLHYASLLLFAVEIAGLSSTFILYHSDLSSQVDAFIYYGAFVLLSIYSFFSSIQKKDLHTLYNSVVCNNVYNFWTGNFQFYGRPVI